MTTTASPMSAYTNKLKTDKLLIEAKKKKTALEAQKTNPADPSSNTKLSAAIVAALRTGPNDLALTGIANSATAEVFHEKLTEKTKELEDKKIKLAETKQKITDTNKRVIALEKEFEETKAKINNGKDEVDTGLGIVTTDINQALDKIAEKRRSLETELASKSAEYEDLASNVSELDSSQIDAKLKLLRQQAVALETQIKKIKIFTQKIEEFQEKQEELTEEKNTLTNAATGELKVLQDLETRLTAETLNADTKIATAKTLMLQAQGRINLETNITSVSKLYNDMKAKTLMPGETGYNATNKENEYNIITAQKNDAERKTAIDRFRKEAIDMAAGDDELLQLIKERYDNLERLFLTKAAEDSTKLQATSDLQKLIEPEFATGAATGAKGEPTIREADRFIPKLENEINTGKIKDKNGNTLAYYKDKTAIAKDNSENSILAAVNLAVRENPSAENRSIYDGTAASRIFMAKEFLKKGMTFNIQASKGQNLTKQEQLLNELSFHMQGLSTSHTQTMFSQVVNKISGSTTLTDQRKTELKKEFLSALDAEQVAAMICEKGLDAHRDLPLFLEKGPDFVKEVYKNIKTNDPDADIATKSALLRKLADDHTTKPGWLGKNLDLIKTLLKTENNDNLDKIKAKFTNTPKADVLMRNAVEKEKATIDSSHRYIPEPMPM